MEKEFSIEALTIPQDLSDLDSADKIYNELLRKKVHVRLLINNAGFGLSCLYHENDRQKNLDLIKVMCLSVADLTYKFLPGMLERGSGGIIITSSVAAFIPTPTFAIYGAAKGFSLNLGICLHAEYENKGIDVLTLCPGWVDTNIYKVGGVEAPKTPLMTTKYVATKSLDALGKDIILTLTKHQWDIKISLLLARFGFRKLLEKLIRNRIKKNLGRDL